MDINNPGIINCTTNICRIIITKICCVIKIYFRLIRYSTTGICRIITKICCSIYVNKTTGMANDGGARKRYEPQGAS